MVTSFHVGHSAEMADVESMSMGWELPGFPTSHPFFDVFGYRQLCQDWEIKKYTSDPLSKLMLLWKMNTDGESMENEYRWGINKLMCGEL